jgi:hypothetical protein
MNPAIKPFQKAASRPPERCWRQKRLLPGLKEFNEPVTTAETSRKIEILEVGHA